MNDYSVTYMVFYSEGASPNVRHFKSERAAKMFVSKFLKSDKVKNNPHDNWIDAIILGRVVQKYEGWFGIKEKE